MEILVLIISIFIFYKIFLSPKAGDNAFSKQYKRREKNSKIKIVPGNNLPSNKVNPRNIPIYKQKEWVQSKNAFYGYYYTPYGNWYGEIIRRGDKLVVYIIDPPLKQLRLHTKWACFHKKGNHKVWLHLQRQPKDYDIGSVIVYVEHLISESFRKSLKAKKPRKSSPTVHPIVG